MGGAWNKILEIINRICLDKITNKVDEDDKWNENDIGSCCECKQFYVCFECKIYMPISK